ncbi:tetratricopeptide repeat protein [Thioclava sp. BHET1]|nr:tetratricopeptide repeat protein [Thioclava sp. BHET1]
MASAFSAGILALAVPLAAPAEAPGQDFAGPYLAGQVAKLKGDYAAEASYLPEALAQDPGNPDLMEDVLAADLAVGDFKSAVPLAGQLRKLDDKSIVANLVILSGLLQSGQYDQALGMVDGGTGVGPLVDGLVKAWAEVGAGKMSDALKDFDTLSQNGGVKQLAQYHKALAMASVGDFEGAEKIFSGGTGVTIAMTRHALIAYAEVLSQLDKDDAALKVIDAQIGTGADPQIDALRTRLKAGETLPFDVVRTAKDGLSEVFFTVAAALKGDHAEPGFTLIYARIAEFLQPDNSDATLLVAGLLEQQKQYPLAIAAYGHVSRGDPAYYAAQQGRAQALYASGDIDAGIGAMQQLAQAHPDLIDVQIALGDLLRRQDRFQEAVGAYDAAVKLLPDPQPQDWVVFYMRGVCEERMGNWSRAEPDLRAALKLNPNQPEVLNYLGYAMVDRGEKLEEGLKFIQRAVNARPNDGYIVDSLAWAMYRLGEAQKALPVAEKASQLMPVDAVVTDHLGDIYWAVGRKLEARFQWHRALAFDPDADLAAQLRKKLEQGPDAPQPKPQQQAARGKASDDHGG